MSLKFLLSRKNKSYDFKISPQKNSSFENNHKNNMQDWLILFDDKAEIIRFPCQSVANYNFCHQNKNDCGTIRAEEFKVQCFLEPNVFYGETHGIIETKNIEGQVCKHEPVQEKNNGYQTGYWLIYSSYSPKLNCDTDFAWSTGGIVLSSANLDSLNKMLHAYNVETGAIICGEIEEEILLEENI